MSLAYLYYEYDYINFLQIVCLSNYKSLFFSLHFSASVSARSELYKKLETLFSLHSLRNHTIVTFTPFTGIIYFFYHGQWLKHRSTFKHCHFKKLSLKNMIFYFIYLKFMIWFKQFFWLSSNWSFICYASLNV